jgi:hypothetical protein
MRRSTGTTRSLGVTVATGALALLVWSVAGLGLTPSAALAATITTSTPATATPGISTMPTVPAAASTVRRGVKVPSIVGVSSKKAVAILRKAGFKVLFDRSIHSRKIGRYRIAIQKARAGKLVKLHSTIRVVASLGPVPPAPRYAWKTAQASFFGGAGEIQSVAGPYPNTGYMNAHGPYYFANKTMPFGTKVAFNYNGRTIVAVCADRGPYAGNRMFDLGANVAYALHFDVGTIRWAYAK